MSTTQASTGLWTAILNDFTSGQSTVGEVTDLIKAVTTAIDDVNKLRSSTIFGSISQNFPQVLTLVERVLPAVNLGNLAPLLGVVGPVGGAIGLALTLMSMSHGMPVGSPEEKAWFDRASGGPSVIK